MIEDAIEALNKKDSQVVIRDTKGSRNPRSQKLYEEMGKGLFARKKIESGIRLTPYAGEWVVKDVCAVYDQICTNKFGARSSDGRIASTERDPRVYWMKSKHGSIIDASNAFLANESRYVNAAPNPESANVRFVQDETTNEVFIETVARLLPGEQLFAYYDHIRFEPQTEQQCEEEDEVKTLDVPIRQRDVQVRRVAERVVENTSIPVRQRDSQPVQEARREVWEARIPKRSVQFQRKLA